MRTFLFFAFCFLLFSSPALTREEIIERFRATPVINTEGLIQVIATCPADMRREYQLPIAGFAADVCKSLYAAEARAPIYFAAPGIMIYIGDERTNRTDVIARIHERTDGTRYTKIYLPAPGFADRRVFSIALTRAFTRAVHNQEISDKQARHVLMSSNPDLRIALTCEMLENWSSRGIYEEGMDDEDYLKLSRKVLQPGKLSPFEYRQFASRLFLYPLAYDTPFQGKYASIDFATAIRLCRTDPIVRYAALVKARQVIIFGAGRTAALQEAAQAYATFLTELSRAEKTDGELLALLATAESKLKGASE